MLSRNRIVLTLWLLVGCTFRAPVLARPPLPRLCRDAPELAKLLLPTHVPPGTYTACAIDLGLEDALARVKQDPAFTAWPDAWHVEALAPLDAFAGGPYNRWALAQLYEGTPARVARGPRVEDGRTVEAWTLISPYPDAALRHLESGTLFIVLHFR
jgi:hypothetical protein